MVRFQEEIGYYNSNLIHFESPTMVRFQEEIGYYNSNLDGNETINQLGDE